MGWFGAGIGATIGALIGGPVGAAIGAAVGGVLGEEEKNKNKKSSKYRAQNPTISSVLPRDIPPSGSHCKGDQARTSVDNEKKKQMSYEEYERIRLQPNSDKPHISNNLKKIYETEFRKKHFSEKQAEGMTETTSTAQEKSESCETDTDSEHKELIIPDIDICQWWNDLNVHWQYIFNKKLNKRDPNLKPGELDQVVLNRSLMLLQKPSLLPENLQELFSVTELHVERHSLEKGNIHDLEPLRYFINLRELYCDDVEISSLSPIEDIISLRKISIFNSQFHKNKISSLRSLKKLTRLSELKFNGFNIVDIEHISVLSNLRTLQFSGTQISSLEPIRNLRNLSFLAISGHEITDLTPLYALTNLEELWFSDTNVSSLKPLGKLIKLKGLTFNNTKIDTLSPIANLTNLKTLEFENCKVNSLEPLSAIISLLWIHCDNNPIVSFSPLRNMKELVVLSCEGVNADKIEINKIIKFKNDNIERIKKEREEENIKNDKTDPNKNVFMSFEEYSNIVQYSHVKPVLAEKLRREYDKKLWDKLNAEIKAEIRNETHGSEHHNLSFEDYVQSTLKENSNNHTTTGQQQDTFFDWTTAKQEELSAAREAKADNVFSSLGQPAEIKNEKINEEAPATVEQAFRQHNVNCLWHMTHRDNIAGILQEGLLSHNQAHRKHVGIADISNQDVQTRRDRKDPIYGHSIHDYTPLYIRHKNPMLSAIREKRNELCLIEIACFAICGNEYLLSDGNAASNNTTFFSSINDIGQLPWDVLNGNYWPDMEDGSRKMCSEVLIYPSIDPSFIRSIHCYSEETRNMLNNCGRPVKIDKKMFF